MWQTAADEHHFQKNTESWMMSQEAPVG